MGEGVSPLLQKQLRSGPPPTPPSRPHPSAASPESEEALIPIGSYVVASGLQVQVEVNGSVGCVKGHGDDGAVLVTFPTHGNLALHSDRLSIVPGPQEPEATQEVDDTGSTESTCQSNSTGCCPASPVGDDAEGTMDGTVGPESVGSTTSSPGCRSITQSPVPRPSVLHSPQGKEGWSLRIVGEAAPEYLSPSGKEFAASAGLPAECRQWLLPVLRNRILRLSPVALPQAADTIAEVLLTVCETQPLRVFPLAVSSPVADAELRTHAMVTAGVQAHMSYVMADAHAAVQRAARPDIFFGDHLPCLEIEADP